MKRFIKQFRYGEKGFTLIELLVVVAILGILAAVAIPNVGKFIGKGKEEAKKTEIVNVQTAVIAAMADANTANVTGGSDTETENFGNSGHNPTTPTGLDCQVAPGPPEITVGQFVVGGPTKVSGSYWIKKDGTVEQKWYPD